MTNQIQKAVAILRAGGLVGLPTETVYGLGADAKNPQAVARVFAAKGRPADHPLIVHIASPMALNDWALEVPPEALQLAQAFWPGPLTLVLKKAESVLSEVTGGQSTVALRMPRHPMALALIKAFGGGLVAPSANQFTRLSPTTADAVRAELGEAVDLVLDGGRCELGLESTIIGLSGPEPCLLRQGMISQSEIEAVLGHTLSLKATQRAPGQHPLHYSPRTTSILASLQDIENLDANVSRIILSHSLKNHPIFPVLAMPSRPHAYAHELYHQLRQIDQNGYDQIVIEQVPIGPAWRAISDRLVKACGNSA